MTGEETLMTGKNTLMTREEVFMTEEKVHEKVFAEAAWMFLMKFDRDKDCPTEAEIIRVLGHTIRLKIIACLCCKPCNVKHICEWLGLRQQTVSQHLALLKYGGIVSSKKAGHEVYYSVVHPLAKKIIEFLGESYNNLPVSS